MSFIVDAQQLGGNQIRVQFDDDKVTHYPGVLRDFTTKAVITELSDGTSRVFYADGRVKHISSVS